MWVRFWEVSSLCRFVFLIHQESGEEEQEVRGGRRASRSPREGAVQRSSSRGHPTPGDVGDVGAMSGVVT